jgi:hypothetical protein
MRNATAVREKVEQLSRGSLRIAQGEVAFEADLSRPTLNEFLRGRATLNDDQLRRVENAIVVVVRRRLDESLRTLWSTGARQDADSAC